MTLSICSYGAQFILVQSVSGSHLNWICYVSDDVEARVVSGNLHARTYCVLGDISGSDCPLSAHSMAHEEVDITII